MMRLQFLILVCCAIVSHNASSLNIILTNDDGWETENIRVLKERLTKAGHNVVLVAPCLEQSGKGASVFFYIPIPVDTSRAEHNEYCVGDTDTSKPVSEFGTGTPTTAVAYALDVVAPKLWGERVDLLISGPNVGANTGFAVQRSGTINAAMAAIQRGLPAIAVSANEVTETDKAESRKVVSIVMDLLTKLEKSRKAGEPLLPRHMGLSVNLPRNLDSHKGLKFVQTGWATARGVRFSEDISAELDGLTTFFLDTGRAKNVEEAHAVLKPWLKRFEGKGGLVLDFTRASLDVDESSEGNALASGFVTISTLEANGDRKLDYINSRLSDM
jgi:5'-nucleotidase